MKRVLGIALACGLALGPAAGGAQAARFTTKIDNPYLPLAPGSRWIYRDTLTGERVVVAVTHRTKRIANGVNARVVRDTVRRHGRLVEDTFDWYAQDDRGNVWYMGEDTKEYEHGKVSSTAGSWEAGVDGARAGIAMPAHPRVGRAYRQELYAGHAEDHARVLSRDDQAEVPAGHYKRALLTKEWTPLEPDVLEYKLYARGVGMVLSTTVSGGAEREELISFRR
jgi:hypothetical protein